jgi:hypothetical protein
MNCIHSTNHSRGDCLVVGVSLVHPMFGDSRLPPIVAAGARALQSSKERLRLWMVSQSIAYLDLEYVVYSHPISRAQGIMRSWLHGALTCIKGPRCRGLLGLLLFDLHRQCCQPFHPLSNGKPATILTADPSLSVSHHQFLLVRSQIPKRPFL